MYVPLHAGSDGNLCPLLSVLKRTLVGYVTYVGTWVECLTASLVRQLSARRISAIRQEAAAARQKLIIGRPFQSVPHVQSHCRCLTVLFSHAS